ncbi:MAG TPA: hypothetical protein PLB70_04780 [Paludibacteraceae bacterium]|nr:hypothetical protein [Paludibacteraceae bacterium]
MKKLDGWLSEPSLNMPQLSNWDRLSVLFAKNKNSLLPQHFDLSIGMYGLTAYDAIELSHYNGVMFGYLLQIGKEMDPQFLTENILNRLILLSKNFGYNIGKQPMVYIKAKTDT